MNTESLKIQKLHIQASKKGYNPIPVDALSIPDQEELQEFGQLLQTTMLNIEKQFKTLKTIQNYLQEDLGSIEILLVGYQDLIGYLRKEPPKTSKMVFYKMKGFTFVFKHHDYELLISLTGKTLHLQHIEINRSQRGKGLGKMIMDIILDGCDINECDITTVPTDIQGEPTTLKRIRQFYTNKNFRRINDYMFKYYHEKVELQ